MATGKVKTLYSDEAKTEALFPRTKTSAVSDENGRSVDALLDNMDNKIDNLTAADVGARPDSWLPSAYQINAVHEFNYGGSANNEEEFMAIIQNCVDALASDRITHVSIMMHGRHSVIIHKHLNGYVDIEDISYQYALSGTTYYYKRVRSCYNNNWLPWEWVNPSMALGASYCTTERYKGKPVHAITQNIGALGNNSTVSVHFGINYAQIVRINTVIYDANERAAIQLDSLAGNGSGGASARGYYSSESYHIHSFEDMSSRSASVTIYYTGD